MSEKITGYLLLVVGIGIMVFCVVNVVMVFTNKAKPFAFFNLSSTNSGINVQDIVAQIQKNSSNSATQASLPKLDLFPPEMLNQTLNLTTHFFLMSFILGFGYKLANLGVQLIRPINVKLKSHLLEVMNDGTQKATSGASPAQSLPPSMPLQPVQPTQPT